MSPTASSSAPKIRVGIVGAGIGGLTLANGLINDPQQRYDVTVFERDTVAFSSERGGYVLRLANSGFQSLKSVADSELWQQLQAAWAGQEPHAPSFVEPKSLKLFWRLQDSVLYPKSLPIARTGLRDLLIKRPLAQNRVHLDRTFSKFEITGSDSEHKIVVHFENPETNPPAEVDILIAADGSRSRINQQVGLKNKTKIGGMSFVQTRSQLSADQMDQLPKVLRDEKAILFLGGNKMTGFVSLYDHFDTVEQGATGDSAARLFWAASLPDAEGQDIFEKANGDHDKIREYLAQNLVDKGCDPAALPRIIRTGDVEDMRTTNQLTSSSKPTYDWRASEPALSRVILLGDAIHPMTPGRGQGANQTMVDAANLTRLMVGDGSPGAVPNTDAHWQELVREFDAEMYDRAFKLVKSSEDVTSLDMTSYGGYLTLSFAWSAMKVACWCSPVLRLLGVWTPAEWE